MLWCCGTCNRPSRGPDWSGLWERKSSAAWLCRKAVRRFSADRVAGGDPQFLSAQVIRAGSCPGKTSTTSATRWLCPGRYRSNDKGVRAAIWSQQAAMEPISRVSLRYVEAALQLFYLTLSKDSE